MACRYNIRPRAIKLSTKSYELLCKVQPPWDHQGVALSMSNRSGTLTFNENMERSNYKGTLMDLTVDFKKTKTTRPSNRDPTTLMAYKLITELNSMLTRHLPNNLMGSISHAEDKYREKKLQ